MPHSSQHMSSLVVEANEDQSRKTVSGPWTFVSLMLGVILLALAAIFTRLTENELSVLATVFNRYLFATMALGLWELFQRNNEPDVSPATIASTDRNLIGLSSILGTLAVSLWALSLTQTSVANSNLLHNITPIFAVIGGWLFMNQQFSAQYLLGILLAIAGVAMISAVDLQQSSSSLLGDGIALLSAVFYASNYLIREKLRTKFTTSQILFWTCLLSSLYTGLLVFSHHVQVFPHTWQTWCSVLGLALACQVLGQGLLVHHLKQFSASFVTLLMLLEPLITASLAALIFGERLSKLNWLAFVVVLTGIYLARSSQGASTAGQSGPIGEDP